MNNLRPEKDNLVNPVYWANECLAAEAGIQHEDHQHHGGLEEPHGERGHVGRCGYSSYVYFGHEDKAEVRLAGPDWCCQITVYTAGIRLKLEINRCVQPNEFDQQGSVQAFCAFTLCQRLSGNLDTHHQIRFKTHFQSFSLFCKCVQIFLAA